MFSSINPVFCRSTPSQTLPEQWAFSSRMRSVKCLLPNNRRCLPETRQVSAWTVSQWRCTSLPFAGNESSNQKRWARLLSVHSVSSSSRESPELTQTLTWEQTVQRAAHYSSTAHCWINTEAERSACREVLFLVMTFISAYDCARWISTVQVAQKACEWHKWVLIAVLNEFVHFS